MIYSYASILRSEWITRKASSQVHSLIISPLTLQSPDPRWGSTNWERRTERRTLTQVLYIRSFPNQVLDLFLDGKRFLGKSIIPNQFPLNLRKYLQCSRIRHPPTTDFSHITVPFQVILYEGIINLVIYVCSFWSGHWVDWVDEGIYSYRLQSCLWAVWSPDLASAIYAGWDLLVNLAVDLLVSQLWGQIGLTSLPNLVDY